MTFGTSRGFAVAAIVASALALAACSDDDDDGGKGGTGGTGGSGASGGSSGASGSGGSAGSSGSSGAGGSSGSAGSAGSAGSGGSAGGSNAFSGIVPLSDSLDDRLNAVAFDATGKLVAAGFIQVASGSDDTQLALARMDNQGKLDASFGTNGVAVHNVKVGGSVESAGGVALQSDGKIIVCGQVEHDPNATEADADGVVARFNSDGTLDGSFGDSGVKIVDFGTGAGNIADTIYDCDVDAQDDIVLFASAKNAGGDHRDRVIARLTKDGDLDATFAGTGIFVLDVDALGLNDNARNGFIQSDGKIVSAGYTPVNGQNEIVLIRLNADGTPDDTFGGDGVVRENPMSPGMAEAYAAVAQSDGKYVTTGYGRITTSGVVDLVSFRFSAAGALDDTWASAGGFVHDIAGDDDRGRNAVVLSDDRVVMVGSGSPAVGTIDAMVLVLDKNGALSTSFSSDGVELYDFGNPDEALFGVAQTGDAVAAVGYTLPSSGDRDSVLVYLPL